MKVLEGFQLCAAMLVSFGAISSQCAAPDSDLFSAKYFGMHIHRLTTTDSWQRSGAGAIRLHDVNTTWADIETRPGVYDWQRLDALVALANSAGLEVLYVVQGTPAWAAFNPTEKSAYGMGAGSPPKDINDWRNFLRALSSRYKGRIAAYEVWNEPNLRQFFSGTPRDLAALTVVARQTVSEADNGARIVCSGITGDYGLTWLRDYLALAGRSCDVIGYHLYARHMVPERMIPIARSVRQIRDELGLNELPMWNTESGWLIGVSDPALLKLSGFPADAPVISQQVAIGYVVRTLLLVRWSGFQRHYWYSWDHPSMGLSGERGKVFTPPAKAYRETVDAIRGRRLENCTEVANIWQCELTSQGGGGTYFVWTERGERIERSKYRGTLSRFDANGLLREVGEIRVGDLLTITGIPVVISTPESSRK